MCGIAGFLDTYRKLAEPEEAAVRMVRQLAHRGPDDEGIWVDHSPGIALAQRRLSILDLSPLGHQPMFSASGRYAIVFNGEIYNYAELKSEVAGSWRGGSDTEVMLACFDQWGIENALGRFNGMFAFAVWDRVDRRLTLARDRMGEKPLYYGWSGGVFLFASELKALRAFPGFEAEIDRDVLAAYFRYNYVPGPHCIYRGIRKLQPGTWLQADARCCREDPEVRSYWSASAAITQGMTDGFLASEQDSITALDDRLRRTVASRMISDVPLGAFLSGGIDSSLIVAQMQAVSPRPVRTFTIAFHEEAYNESQHARAVAEHLGTDHTEMHVTPSEALAVMPNLGSIYDEPFADASQVPTVLIASLARRHVTVALSGDGGDELFGGYTRYSWHDTLWRTLTAMPEAARTMTGMGLRLIPRTAWERALRLLAPLTPKGFRQRNPGENLERLEAMLRAGDPGCIYRELISIWPKPDRIVRGGREPEDAEAFAGPANADSISRLMWFDTVRYLPDDILVKVDRASMSVGLEARAPFLDHEVFEFAARLPMRMKVRDGRGKWILRRVLDRYLPPEIMNRPKAGFAVPLDGWLRGRLRPWAEDLLSERRLDHDGFLESGEIRAKWAEHLSGRRDWMYRLWGVLMFQSWLETQRAAPQPVEPLRLPPLVPVGT